MTKRVYYSEFPDYREAKSERINAAWLRTKFIRRDATRREADYEWRRRQRSAVSYSRL